MLYPTMSMIFIVIGILSVLMATNWFVWGLTSTPDARIPQGLSPINGSRDAHQAGRHDDGGFKRVA